MATFIPQVQDQSAPIPYAPTNYQFLQTQMDRANAMYESGLQEVKSGYASILNTPVTGVEANERKNKYIQDAQNKLRTLSSKDLSLPQNVVQAEAAYAPFWEDNLLITNSAYTRKIDKENNKLDSWINSTDEEERSLYSDHNKRALQKVSGILANTPMNAASYAKLANEMNEARAIPYYNIDKEAMDSFKSMFGNDIEKGPNHVTLGNGAMYTEYNGPNSYDAYRTWYIAHAANEKYQPQLRQQAWLQVQDRRKEILSKNPTIAPDEVDKMLAKNRMKELHEVYSSQENSYTKLINDYNDKINDLRIQVSNQKGQMQPADKMQLDVWTNKLKQYTALRDNISHTLLSDYTETIDGRPNEEYYKKLSDIATNPVNYLTNIDMVRAADMWATKMSSVTREKVEVNPIEHETNYWRDKEIEHQLKIAELRISEQRVRNEMGRLSLDAQKADDELFMKTGINRRTGEVDSRFTGANGWAGSLSAGSSLANADVYPYTIDPQKVDNLLGQIEAEKNAPRDMAFGEMLNVTDPNGFGSIVLGKYGMGLSDREMNDLTSLVNSMLTQGAVEGTAQQKAVWNKVKDNLVKEGVVKKASDITGPWTLFPAMKAYAPKVSNKLVASNADYKHSIQDALAMSQGKMDSYMEEYIDAEHNFNERVRDKIVSDERFQPLVVQEGNSKRVLTPKDIANKLPKEITIYEEQGSVTNKQYVPVKLSRDDIANAYMSGNLFISPGRGNGSNGGVITIYGKTYSMPPSMFPRDPLTSEEIAYANVYGELNKIGKSEDIANLRKLAGAEAAKNLNINNGLIYQSIVMDPNDPDEGKAGNAIKLARDLSPIANTTNFYTYDSNGKEVLLKNQDKGDQLIQDIRSITASNKEMKDRVANIQIIKDLGVAAITLRPNISDNDKTYPLAGKTVYMRLTPTAMGGMLGNIPSGMVKGPLAGLLRGKDYYSSPTMRNSGMEWSLTGMNNGPDGKPTVAMWSVDYRDENSANVTRRYPFPLVGRNSKTLVEINDAIKSMESSYLSTKETQRKAKTQQIAATPTR